MDKHHWRHNLHACTWAEFRGLVLNFAPQYIYIGPYIQIYIAPKIARTNLRR